QPPPPTLFPYTTLFRSVTAGHLRSLHSLAERHERIDVDRNVLRCLKGALQLGRHLVVLREPRLGAGTIARGLNGEQFFRQCRQRSEEHTSELQSPCNLV